MATVHLLIKGKVQGVFYRANAKDKAAALQLKGWVKNTRSGDVEAVANGDEEAIKKFIAWCHQGPPQAIVTSVEVTVLEEQSFSGFNISR